MTGQCRAAPCGSEDYSVARPEGYSRTSMGHPDRKVRLLCPGCIRQAFDRWQAEPARQVGQGRLFR